MTYTWVLKRALLAALVVGLLAGGYLLTVVEPVIDRAIALEEQMSSAASAGPAHDGHHEEPLFTRDEQRGGGSLAMVLFTLVVGLAAGTLFAWRRHVLPGSSDFVRSVWLGLMGFAAFALLPAIKYPANPPAVGDPDTVGERTLQYVSIIAISLVLIVALSRLSRALRSRLDDVARVVVVAVVAVALFGVLMAVMPASPDQIDPAVPAALVWDFRLRSIGGLALVWVGFGLLFGLLLSRRPADAAAPADAARLAVAGA